ncbi:uncharacterized protein PFL1_02055 [Pseudozyma flocculosa PF-1]|uniref:uncharacterized protein n=1 Tax=Pseudozyma flocculosa PF-1 TaxID=1277687 RepID=UPI00045614D6|nr:uncharacterized protein PFL1_02055 [Pseudozyma flocculosa PF-1]EPQ30529.1 hypothetical protein PFL1_02055 [Pseudozyma flocculosa PF-1]
MACPCNNNCASSSCTCASGNCKCSTSSCACKGNKLRVATVVGLTQSSSSVPPLVPASMSDLSSQFTHK